MKEDKKMKNYYQEDQGTHYRLYSANKVAFLMMHGHKVIETGLSEDQRLVYFDFPKNIETTTLLRDLENETTDIAMTINAYLKAFQNVKRIIYNQKLINNDY